MGVYTYYGWWYGSRGNEGFPSGRASLFLLKCNDYVDGMVALGPPNATGPYIYHVHGKRPTHPKKASQAASFKQCAIYKDRPCQARGADGN